MIFCEQLLVRKLDNQSMNLKAINEKIAAEMKAEERGVDPALKLKLDRAARGIQVKVTPEERERWAEVFASGYVMHGSAQICLGEAGLFKL